jgi:hypothetical protein
MGGTRGIGSILNEKNGLWTLELTESQRLSLHCANNDSCRARVIYPDLVPEEHGRQAGVNWLSALVRGLTISSRQATDGLITLYNIFPLFRLPIFVCEGEGKMLFLCSFNQPRFLCKFCDLEAVFLEDLLNTNLKRYQLQKSGFYRIFPTRFDPLF